MKTQIRLLLTLFAVVLGSLLVLYHQNERKESRAVEVAIQSGLQRLYGRLTNDQSRATNAALFAPEDLARVVRDELSQSRFFPGVVKASDVSVSTIPVARDTTNLLWAIEPWQKTKYGIDGAGGCRRLSDAEYRSWPHLVMAGSQ